MASLADVLAYQQRQKEMLNEASDQSTDLEKAVQNQFGLQPNVDRAALLPYKSKTQGWVAPEAVYQLAKLLASPVTALKGGNISTKEALEGGQTLSGFMSPAAVSGPIEHGVARAYLPTRPKMPAEVGTRFTTVDQGGLLPKKPFNLEEHKGSSILITPWDQSSRNQLITSVSDDPLLNPVLTHGGQQYARDIQHQAQNVAGASGGDIVKRIADRVDVARKENLEQGGTGKILNTPITMGEFSENYSVMPTQIMMDFIERRSPSKAKIQEINSFIRNEAPGHKAYPAFKGIETPEGRDQLLQGGHGIDAAGQLRKKFIDKMYKEDNEKYFGFNRQDVSNAITDPSLLGVGRGHGLNTVISHGDQPLILSPSTNLTYPTNFSGEYVGSLGNVPVQEFMPGVFRNIAKEYEKSTYSKGAKAGQPWSDVTKRDAVIGALEKRKAGISQIINDEVINRVGEYLRNQQAR